MEATALKTIERIKKSKYKITVGLATNSEGVEIQRLVEEAGFKEDLDWQDIYPYWLIALHEDKIIGAIQVCLGKPIGRLEMLTTEKDLTGTQRAQVVALLLAQGIKTLKLHGVQMAAGLIDFKLKSYKKLIKRRGGWIMATGNLLGTKI